MGTQHERIQKLVVSAVMVALAAVLAMIAVFQLPNGGSVTVASMAPILILSLLYSTRWSIFTALVYAGIQMLEGFYPPPTQDFISFLLVILLDYVIAFGVLGFAGCIARRFKKLVVGATVATIIVIAVRFLCHFLSGILIWNSYAPPEQPVWLYSFLYNGSYMLVELVITAVVMALLVQLLPVFKKKQLKSA